MEGEKKKRKRADHHHHRHAPVNGYGEPWRKEDDEVAAAAAVAQPSEEEVEEFFTILREMNVALKYFEKGANVDINANGVGRKTTASEAAAVDGVKTGKESETSAVVVENGGTGLDLNVAPEAET